MDTDTDRRGNNNSKLQNEYELKDVSRTFVSDDCFTPNTLARITQTTYGKYMIPVHYEDDYCRQKIHVHPRILDKWADRAKDRWVEGPGKNDYFLHNMKACYDVVVVENYSPKNLFKKQLFPRPYECELNYIVEKRLLKGMSDIEAKYKKPETENKVSSSKRWKPIKEILVTSDKSFCQRREEMSQVGQPFHHEACRFYYDHFPAPKLKQISM